MRSSAARLDGLVVALVVAGAGILLTLFFRDLHAVVPGPGGPVLGQISLKHNTATRKLAHALGWQRLYDGAPVYPGDTVRTAGDSDASVLLGDGCSLTVLENSMIRLGSLGTEQELEVTSGTFRLTGGGKTGRVVVAGKSRLILGPDADVSVTAGPSQMKLSLVAGSATVVSAGASAALSVNEEATVDGLQGTIQRQKRQLMGRFPGPGESVVAPDGPSPVVFSVATFGVLSPGARIEVSPDRRFLSGVETVLLEPSDGQARGRADLSPGVWFWRTRSDTESPSDPIRFTFGVSTAPNPTFPDDGAVLGYTQTPPAVRLSWSEAPGARGYRVELTSPGRPSRTLPCRGTSLTVADLGPGRWTWRVWAEFGAATTLAPEPSPGRWFELRVSTDLSPPRTVVPLDGTLYETASVPNKGLVFSWEPEADATAYAVRLGTGPDLSTEIPFAQTNQPWLLVRGTSPLSRPGTHYWAVAWQDAQGRWSKGSPARKIEGVDGSTSLHATFPPDGFLASSGALPDLRFAWSGPSAGVPTLRFVSLEPGQTIEVKADGGSLTGVPLPEGRWSWTVRTPNADRTTFQETKPRSLTVLKALPAPVPLSPFTGTEVVLREGEPLTLRWAAVPQSVGYDVVVQGPRGVVRLAGIRGTSVELPSAESGAYRWEVLGAIEPGPRSTGIPGTWASSSFRLQRFERLKLLSPTRGALFDGLSAWKPGVRLSWSAPDEPASLSLRVTRNGAPFAVPAPVSPKATRVVLSKLPEGSYTWSLRASRLGQDLSPEGSGSFVVTAPPPLPAPTITSPLPGATLGPDWFQMDRTLRLGWTAVEGAQTYAVRLWSPGSPRPVYSVAGLATNQVVLTDLSSLDRGTFLWEVSASRASDEAGPARTGRAAQAAFRISLPSLSVPQLHDTGELYGF